MPTTCENSSSMSSQYTDSAERQWCDFRSQLREHQEGMDLTEWNNHRSQLREQTAPVQEYIENHRGFVVSGATLHAACKDGRLDVCEFLSTFPFFLQKIRNREDSRPQATHREWQLGVLQEPRLVDLKKPQHRYIRGHQRGWNELSGDFLIAGGYLTVKSPFIKRPDESKRKDQ